MPPRRKKARQAEERGEEATERDHLVDDDDDNDDDDNAREERRREKSMHDAKAAKREEHLKLVSLLRKEGLDRLRTCGLKQEETESKGDCWLISILAGHELDSALVPRLSQEQRREKLTPWRQKVSEFAPHIDTKGLAFSGDELGLEYLKQTARLFHVQESVIESCEMTKSWKKTRDLIAKKLKPWKNPFYFGTYQEPVHMCMGVMLQKNILEIDEESITMVGACMLCTIVFLSPCAHSPAHVLCVHACVHRFVQRVDAVGFERKTHDYARERREAHRAGGQPPLPRLGGNHRVERRQASTASCSVGAISSRPTRPSSSRFFR